MEPEIHQTLWDLEHRW